MSIRSKMLIPMILLVIVTVATILVVMIVNFSNFVDGTISSELDNCSAVVQAYVEELKSEATLFSLLLSFDSDIQNAVENGDRQALLRRAAELQKSYGAEFCTITDAAGVVLARTHEPGNFGDSIASQVNVSRALRGDSFTTIEKGSAVRLSIRSGAPIYTQDGTLVGVVSSGYRLDQESFVDKMKTLVSAEVTVFLGDERISTTVLKPDGSRAVGTTADPTVSETVLAGQVYAGNAQVLGNPAFVKYVPIRTYDDSVLGMLFVGRYTSTKDKTVNGFVFQGGSIALIILLAALPIIIVIANRIVAPIGIMVKAANKLADGDINVNVEVRTKDEMSKLAAAFNRMIASTREQARIIEAISGGDLSVSPQVRSEEDAVGNALHTMLALNNDVFLRITDAALLVSMGARQVADGAQVLAQNNTEQAEVVEQLAGSITQVTNKTKDNALMADKAAALAKTIKINAQKGSDQMGNMAQAVKEINEASRAISKVIKVIDDIAFQTNILALNAAVEAARAGEHGKGFAVVSEEVRNLAAKSAAAANDTSLLISNSIEKAKLGAAIADETVKSLSEIVAGINESSQIAGEIAQSSEEQSDAIQQINQGIDRVAQVVQENSAAAEESAATSETLSAQSSTLTELISQFKLAKNADATVYFDSSNVLTDSLR